MNSISMKLNADKLIMQALEEDITSEDITTNAVMRHPQQGEVQLLCKQDGVIAGLDVFKRVFELLDETTQVVFYVKDGDAVKKGDLMLEFDSKAIAAAGYDITTPVIISNSYAYQSVEMSTESAVRAGDALITVTKG